MVASLNTQGKEVEPRTPAEAIQPRQGEAGNLPDSETSLQGSSVEKEVKQRAALQGELAKEASLEKQETAAKASPTGNSKASGDNPVVQVLKHISGYQPANSLAPISGANAWSSALKLKQHLQKVSSGDPKKAITWQAALLLKILRVLFRI